MDARIRSLLTLDAFIACIGTVSLLLAVAWGYSRNQFHKECVLLTQERLKRVSAELKKLPREPKSLDELVQKNILNAEMLNDGWGFPMRYEPDEFDLFSLGADGLEGGSGFAADLRPERR